MTTPRPLTAADWIVTGNEIVAWIDDTELFDITFDGATQRFALRINNVATAQSVFLGFTSSVAEAQQRARSHVGTTADALEIAAQFGIDPDDDELDQLRCPHGRTMLEICPDC